jgi:hypothetical protein
LLAGIRWILKEDLIVKPPVIELLLSPGCPATEETMKMVEAVLDELGLKVNVSEVVVKTSQEARDSRFLGSPSIRLDGKDIEPGSENRQNYGLQ